MQSLPCALLLPNSSSRREDTLLRLWSASWSNTAWPIEQQAKEELWKEVYDAGKDINEVCLWPHPVPEPLLTRVLNLARLVRVIYKDNKDRYTHPDPESKQMVASDLIHPVPPWPDFRLTRFYSNTELSRSETKMPGVKLLIVVLSLPLISHLFHSGKKKHKRKKKKEEKYER